MFVSDSQNGAVYRLATSGYSLEPLIATNIGKSGQGTAEVRLLDETNAKHAMENPESFRAQRGKAVQSVGGKIELKLLPFALARVDLI